VEKKYQTTTEDNIVMHWRDRTKVL